MIGHQALTLGRLLILAGLLALCTTHGHAQDVLACAGGSFSNATYSIAFSIGEPVIATHAQAGVIATQGFHQPENDFSTGVAAVQVPDVDVLAYPNPTRDELVVEVNGLEGTAILELTDAVGRKVQGPIGFLGRTVLDVRSLAAGTYYARITSTGRYLTTVQLSITR